MKVAVLGCGPAGLLAAHAAKQMGADEVVIISKKQASPIGGAQYLHSLIPGLTSDEPDGTVTYVKMGTSRGYAEKVYGSPLAPTSWAEFKTGEHPYWSMRKAYQKLWDLWESRITNQIVKPPDIDFLCAEYDTVFCTLPAMAMCQTPRTHVFKSQAVVLAPSNLVTTILPETVVYSGRDTESWYRCSSIDGNGWMEFARHGYEAEDWPGYYGQIRGVKPISTDCECHQHHPNFFRLGRFGQYEKAVLVSDAYKEARLIMADYEVMA